MFGMTVRVKDNTKRVTDAAEKATFRNLFHASARIRKDWAASIVRADEPSLPGEPPHTHRRIFFRRSLRFAVDKERDDSIIGPRASIVGDVGQALEFGGSRGDTRMEARPSGFPALERNVERFADDWVGSIGE